ADLTQILKAEPGNVGALRQRGVIYSKLREDAKALADLDEVIRRDPRDAAALNQRSRVWLNKRDDKRAIAAADSAARIEPDRFAFQLNRCTVRLSFLSDLETARSACDAAVRINSSDIDGLTSRGLVNLMLGGFDVARTDFNSCLTGLRGAEGKAR